MAITITYAELICASHSITIFLPALFALLIQQTILLHTIRLFNFVGLNFCG